MTTRLLVVGAVIVAGCSGPESFHDRSGANTPTGTAGMMTGTAGTIAIMVPGTAGVDGTAGAGVAGDTGGAGAAGGAAAPGTAGVIGGTAGISGGAAGAQAGAGPGTAGAAVDAGAGGKLGTAGASPPDAAVEAPPPKPYSAAQWKATASITAAGAADLPPNALDGNITTRWTTGRAQTGGETFLIDMGVAQSVGRVVIDDTTNPTDFPAAYTLEISTNNTSFTSVKTGTGAMVTDIEFAPAMARYVRVRQTGTTPVDWLSIDELRIYP
jgi:F5/8 type C domain